MAIWGGTLFLITLAAVVPKGGLRYEGKPFSLWLEEYTENETPKGAVAIRAIGEKAVPELMDRLAPKRGVIPKWVRFTPEQLKLDELFANRYLVEREQALVGLRTLGPKARQVIPALTTWKKSRQEVAEYFEVVLAIDGDPRRTLERALWRGDAPTAVDVLAHITPEPWRQVGPWSPELFDLVRSLTTNSNAQIRRAALNAFLTRNLKPELRQAYLAAGLKDSSSSVQGAILQHIQNNVAELWLVLPEVQSLTNSKTCRLPALQTLAAAKVIPRKVILEEIEKQRREWLEREARVKIRR